MKTKIIILISMMLLGCSHLMAQITISESDVPQDVFISFKYKYPDATIQSWETDKGNFLAKFSIAEQNGVAEFTANGKWLISRFSIIEKELPTPITQYYKENYKSKDYVIAASDMVKDADGNAYYYIQVKKSGINQPKATELFFDLSGNLTKKNDPDEVKVDQEFKVEPIKQNEAKKDIKKDTTGKKTKQDSIIPHNPVAENSFDKKELPTSINNYVKANFPDFGIKESKFFSDPEMGDVYYLILKQQGFKDQIELYFDINGAVVKTIDSREIKAKQVKETKKAPEDKTDVVSDEEKKKAEEQKAAELKKKLEGDPVAETKVPAVAKTHFLSKAKKATNVEWFQKSNQCRMVPGEQELCCPLSHCR
jgi:hypothetical protein